MRGWVNAAAALLGIGKRVEEDSKEENCCKRTSQGEVAEGRWRITDEELHGVLQEMDRTFGYISLDAAELFHDVTPHNIDDGFDVSSADQLGPLFVGEHPAHVAPARPGAPSHP